MKKEEKTAAVAELTEKFSRARLAILTECVGLPVNQVTELRKQLRGAKAEYRVVKNTLVRQAAENTPAAGVMKSFRGSTAIAYNAADPVALAKALSAYAKTNPLFVFKAGVVEGRVVNINDIANIAAMPSKEELIAKLLFLLNSPAQRIAVALKGVSRNLAVVVGQAVEQNKFS